MNTVQLAKKKQELETIRPLLKYLNINVAFDPKQEKPDFKFKYKGKIVGLELVTCCPSSKYDSEEKSIAVINQGKRRNAIRQYNKLLQERKENIVFDVKFSHNAFWHAEPENIFINCVKKEIEDLREKQKEKFLSFERVYGDGQYIESIKLILDGSEEPLIIDSSGQALQRITQEDFNKCVKKKYLKLKKYESSEENSDIDEYWLAVAENIQEPYEFWDVPYDTSLNTRYKRIFLIGYEGVREIETA